MFKYSDTELKILKNFQHINLQMIVKPNIFDVVNNAKNVVGIYDLENSHDHEEYGIYDMSIYNTYLNGVTDLSVDVQDDYVEIRDKASNLKQRQSTTPVDKGMIPIPNDPTTKFESIDPILNTIIPADKISQLLKFADIAKHDRIFIKNLGKTLTLIGGGKDLNNSVDPTMIDINHTNIDVNDLEDVISLSKEELKMLLDGYDYRLEVVQSGKTGNYISRWSNDIISGLRYFVTLEKYEN